MEFQVWGEERRERGEGTRRFLGSRAWGDGLEDVALVQGPDKEGGEGAAQTVGEPDLRAVFL